MSNLGDVAWRVAAAVLVLGLPIGGILTGPGYNGWIASRGESYEVTGAAIARSGDDLYVVVSGYAQRVSQRTDKGHGVTTTDFPRLTSWRVSDGEPVARRPYAPVYVRWSYVDTVVRALTTAAGRVWVVSTEPETGLHAVDPVTLADVIDRAALEAIAPALRAGLHVEPSESPVLFDGRELLLRVESGSWLAVDPTDGAARDLGVEGREWTELQRAGEPRGAPAVEALARGRPGALEPRVVATLDVDGHPDPDVSYVISQTSLDRERAGLRVTRWDTTGAEPREGWTIDLPDAHPDCCAARVWRADGVAVLWYERWLAALDDATGAVRWVRRL